MTGFFVNVILSKFYTCFQSTMLPRAAMLVKDRNLTYNVNTCIVWLCQLICLKRDVNNTPMNNNGPRPIKLCSTTFSLTDKAFKRYPH